MIKYICFLIFVFYILNSDIVLSQDVNTTTTISLIVSSGGNSNVLPCGENINTPCNSIDDAYKTFMMLSSNSSDTLQLEMLDGTYNNAFDSRYLKSLVVIPYSKTVGTVVFSGFYNSSFTIDDDEQYAVSFVNITFNNALNILNWNGDIDVTFDSCTFSNVEQALMDSTVLTLNSSSDGDRLSMLTLNNCVFNNISVGTNILDVQGYHVSISNMVVTGMYGDLVFTNCTGDISNSQFYNNYAKLSTLLFASGSMTIQSCSFINNHSPSVFMLTDDSSDVPSSFVIDSSRFIENTVSGSSPVVISNVFGSVDLQNSVFANNSVIGHDDSGGAISISSTSNVMIEFCIFSNNSALVMGGSLAITNSSVVLLNSDIQGSSASNGGAISSTSDSFVNIKNTTILYNYSKNNGQNVYCAESSLEIYNCTINIPSNYGFDCQSSCSIDSDVGICKYDSTPTKKIIIGLVLGLSGLIAILFVSLLFIRKRLNRKHYELLTKYDQQTRPPY